MQDKDDITNFGFTKVNKNQKQSLVNEIFDSVSSKYDIMNDVMSFGMHRLWKDEFCKKIPNLNSKIIDVASGTGDIAFKLIKRAKIHNQSLDIILCDINQNMLDIAKDKAIDNNILNLKYVCADAQNLPFEDNSFDYYTIAFGIRNTKSIEKVLLEAHRVLKPSGKFLCLEFSKVNCQMLEKFYKFYSFNIIPKIGKQITGNYDAYKYLIESIELFPESYDFATMISEAGFNNVNYNTLTFGVVAIHSGYKL